MARSRKPTKREADRLSVRETIAKHGFLPTELFDAAAENPCLGQADGMLICLDGEPATDPDYPGPPPPQTGGPWRKVWNNGLTPPGFDWENAGGMMMQKGGEDVPVARLASEDPEWVEKVRKPWLERRKRPERAPAPREAGGGSDGGQPPHLI